MIAKDGLCSLHVALLVALLPINEIRAHNVSLMNVRKEPSVWLKFMVST